MKFVSYGVIAVILSIAPNVYAQKIDELLEEIAISPKNKVHFIETRTAYFLDEPLISKGNMEFKAPTTLIKRFNLPEIMEQRIEGNTLSIRHHDGSENVVSLNSNKELAAAINAIRWVLIGDLNSLEKEFSLSYKYIEKKWTIHCVPKDIEVLNTISQIILTGEDSRISQIKVKQSNGDVIKTDLYEYK